jgi:hypothetical protein
MIKELRVDYRNCFNNSALSSTAKRFSRVPSMFDSLGVKIPYPT